MHGNGQAARHYFHIWITQHYPKPYVCFLFVPHQQQSWSSFVNNLVFNVAKCNLG